MSHSDDTPAAGPWALLWIGGLAAATWLSLVLADQFSPTPHRSAGFTSQPPASLPLARHLPVDSWSQPPSAPAASSRAAANRDALPPAQAPFGSPSLPTLSAVITPVQALIKPAMARSQPRVGTLSRQPAGRASSPFRAPSGALLLGGALDLQSLQEKAMVPAARAEQTLRELASDRLQALPLHWRRDMRALLKGKEQVVSPAVVRLPAPHLSRPEEIPLAVRPGGVADTTVQPSSPRSLKVLERWVERQQASLREGQVRPVVVVLEPIAPETTPLELAPAAAAPLADTGALQARMAAEALLPPRP